MSKAAPGDGIAIDPLDSNETVAMSILKAEGGYTRVRLSDATHGRVVEITMQAADVERAWRFLGRCRG